MSFPRSVVSSPLARSLPHPPDDVRGGMTKQAGEGKGATRTGRRGLPRYSRVCLQLPHEGACSSPWAPARAEVETCGRAWEAVAIETNSVPLPENGAQFSYLVPRQVTKVFAVQNSPLLYLGPRTPER